MRHDKAEKMTIGHIESLQITNEGNWLRSVQGIVSY